MNEKDSLEYHYLWEKSRKVFRVVLDDPTYSTETKKTSHNYLTVGKSLTRGGEIIYGKKYLLRLELERIKKEQETLRPSSTPLNQEAPLTSQPSQEVSCVSNQNKGNQSLSEESQNQDSKQESDESMPQVKQLINVGEILVLKKASKETGLEKKLVRLLAKGLGEDVLHLAYYLVSTGEALSNSTEWFSERKLKAITPQRISDILQSLTPETCSGFMKEWIASNVGQNPLCYDITSISTYSDRINIAEYGYNRDKEKHLKQINLALVTDQKTHTPLTFRVLNGSISDVCTVENTIREFTKCGITPFGMIMDRGFWSEKNIEALQNNKIHFMMPIPNNVKWAKEVIRKNESKVYEADEYVDEENSIVRAYTVYDPKKTGHRCWCHLYYSPKMASDQRENRINEHNERRKELQTESEKDEHRSYYEEYFVVQKRNGKRIVKEKKSLKAILSEEIFGFWALYTDIEKDPIKSLEIYRTRNYIETAFDDLKGVTDAKRLRIHSDKAVYGKLFIQFCAQILRNKLREFISEFSSETKKYASRPSTLLSRVRSYTRVVYHGRYKHYYNEPSKGQKLIFRDLKIDYQA